MNLDKTYQQIVEEIGRVSWLLLDEEQKDELMQRVVVPQWGATTADGVKLYATKWAEMLGTTKDTIDARYRRLRRSEDDSGASSTADPIEIRRARSDLKKPGVLKEILSNPELRDAARQIIDEIEDDERLYTPDDLKRERKESEREIKTFSDDFNKSIDECTVAQTGRQAAALIAEMIVEREMFGVRKPDEVEAALDKVEHYIQLYRTGSVLTDEDRRWLIAVGIS